MVEPRPWEEAAMISAKQEVLARIQSALGPAKDEPEVPRRYRRAEEQVGNRDALLELFVDRLRDYRATVRRCRPDEIRDAVADGLADARRVAVPTGLREEWLPEGIDVVRDDGLSAVELDEVDGVVTAATIAMAQTGTIVLDGSSDQGRRALTLVPDLHVCVVWADQVVRDVPEGLAHVAAHEPQTWISGPSATSDIELSRVEGVHGPRTLAVVLVEAGT